MFATSIFPTGSITTVTSGITSAVSNNIGIILGVLAFTVGLSWIFQFLRGALLNYQNSSWQKKVDRDGGFIDDDGEWEDVDSGETEDDYNYRNKKGDYEEPDSYDAHKERFTL